MNTTYALRKRLNPQQLFMLSALVVNGGNYLYNLLLGRWLGPEAFAQAALMVTLLLIVSFAGMTFQLATAKFRSEWEGSRWTRFDRWMRRRTLAIGLAAGALIAVSGPVLASWFNTGSAWPYVVFGIGIPAYFLMSYTRGRLQGAQDFGRLSASYQAEMWSRLLITVILLLLLPPTLAVTLAILLSFITGILPTRSRDSKMESTATLTVADRGMVMRFLLFTAVYECTQILINNGDILLVTHFFEAKQAGRYASLALIGRVVYFITWMFVMILLPRVVDARKNGLPTRPVLIKYLGAIAGIAGSTVLGCFLWPELCIRILFGEAYIGMAPLLGWYALATALFALANLFAYYYLSLDRYLPMIFTAVMGALQVGTLYLYHPSLQAVVAIQVGCMGVLLGLQLLYFLTRKEANKVLSTASDHPSTATSGSPYSPYSDR